MDTEIRGGGGKLTIHRVPGRQRPHVPPHEVCAVLQNRLDGGKDVHQDVSTLITVVYPNIFRALQSHSILSKFCHLSGIVA